ncbi:MAG: MBL fold metallo-hydrolase [Candidatus Shapirobacteria bacterium]|jgi:hypothetical protein
MEIKLLNDYAVFLKGKKENVLINPSEEEIKSSNNNSRIVLFTSDEFDGIGYLNEKILISGPGEYEIGGVEINGFNGEDGNTIYKVIIDGVSLVVLGKLEHDLTPKRIEKIDSTDVLLAPVMIGKEASFKSVKEWSKKWGVNYLIPLFDNNESLKVFLDAADEEGLETIESLKIEKSDLPDGLEFKLLKKS